MQSHIITWSHSSLSDFERCRFFAKLKHVDRIPEPERPLPPGKTEQANDRGTRIHQAAEDFVSGKRPDLISELRSFSTEFEHTRQLYAQGLVSLEGQWAVDHQWAPVGWYGHWVEIDRKEARPESNLILKANSPLPERGRTGQVAFVGKDKAYAWIAAWHRSKIDILILPKEPRAIVIDLKSGKKFGNEIKHGEQTQLYALNTVLRYPHLEEVTTELWYSDIDDLTSVTFTRNQILRFRANWERRGMAVTTAQSFPPNPNKFTCKYCQYGPWNGGQCKDGVQ